MKEKKIKRLKKSEEREFLNRIDNIIYLLTKEHPFYAAGLSRLNKVITYKVPIATVQFTPKSNNLLLNPIGLGKYSDKEIGFILIHELLHVILGHNIRGEGKDQNLFNVVADIEINQLIPADGEYTSFPKGALHPDLYDLLPKLSAEDYERTLLDRGEEILNDNPFLREILEEFANSGCTCESNGSGEGQEDGEGEEQGNGGCPACNSSSRSDENSLANDFKDLHPTWEEDRNRSSEITKGLRENFVKRLVESRPGDVPGELTEVVRELFNPRGIIKKYINAFHARIKSQRSRKSWGRINRKFPNHQNVRIPGKQRLKETELVVAIDTSISVTTEEAVEFLSEIQPLTRMNTKVTLIQCDTQIQEVVDLNEVNLEEFELKGRGGTSFLPVFELLETGKNQDWEYKGTPDGLIYFTDGGGTAPSESKIQTLWILSKGGHKPYSSEGGHIDYGIFATLED